MRVGLIIYGSLDTLSGGYLYDRKLVGALRRAGEQVEVVSLPWRNYARHLADNFSGAHLEQLRGARFDVLLQDELNHPSLFLLNARLRGQISCPIVSIVHHLRISEQRPAWQNGLYRVVERRYLASVDGFVFNSQTTRSVVEGLVGPGRPAVVALPAGDRLGAPLDAEQIAARAQRGGPLRVVFLGNLIRRKGLHTLLDALARLPRGGWELVIVGRPDADPPYARRIRRQIELSDLAARVTLAGPLDDAALAAQLAASDVLAVPSSYEGFGIVYLEGMAFGLPAIATTAGAAGEIITHGQDGFLIEPGGVEELAHCLGTLASDRAHLLAMSLAARQRYTAHPTWAESMARIHRFLQQMAGA